MFASELPSTSSMGRSKEPATSGDSPSDSRTCPIQADCAEGAGPERQRKAAALSSSSRRRSLPSHSDSESSVSPTPHLTRNLWEFNYANRRCVVYERQFYARENPSRRMSETERTSQSGIRPRCRAGVYRTRKARRFGIPVSEGSHCGSQSSPGSGCAGCTEPGPNLWPPESDPLSITLHSSQLTAI